ncbi:hypothetical protein K8S19_01710 [bacterium]|nr:hypothetical protein [bacterium]
MSQIHIEEVDAVPLGEYIQERVSEDTHILLVKGSIKSELFKDVTFPKETHYQKGKETGYQEFVFQYQVEAVIRSDKFKAKDVFWVWKEPAYTYDDMKRYHEEGMLGSPIVLEEKPNYPIKGDRLIVFITNSELENKACPETYIINKKEGMGASEEITNLLGKKLKVWWQFWL